MSKNLSMLLSTWQMVVKRGLAHWKLLISVVVGVVLASAITSGTVIYFDALRQLALTTSLRKHSETDLDVILKGTRSPTNTSEYQKVVSLVNREVDANMASLLQDRIPIGKSATLFLSRPGEEDNANRSQNRTYFAFAPTLLEQITILPGGELPSGQAIESDEFPLVLEALVSRADAEQFGVGVGDRLSAIQTSSVGIPYISVVISGLFEPDDPQNELWALDREALRSTSSQNFITVPFFISQDTFLTVIEQAFPTMSSTYGWLLDVDTSTINSGNSTQSLQSIRTLDSRLKADLFAYRQVTSLDDALSDFDRRLLFSRLQMFVVLILIAVVVLYYVITISSLLIEQNAGEIVLLRGRGASSFQILIVYALEGATISALATVVAPLIASLVIASLGFTPIFSELTDGLLPVNISGSAYAMSALGGILSFLALMIPAFRASHMSVARHRQETSRPTRAPFYQRFYLDVLLLIVGIVLFTQLREQGSLAARGALGEVVENQLLLAAPAVILVAAAMILLRIFPIVLTVLSRVLSPHAPPGALMGIWQMARNPTHYGRLSLLLILMAGLGILAASFGGTLERSFRERVQYSVGSDIRLTGVTLNTTGLSKSIPEAYSGFEGVETVSAAFRGRGVNLTNILGQPYEMLAVDSENFTDLAWFRDDFSSAPLPETIAGLNGVDSPTGLRLPQNTRGFGLLLKADRAQPSVVLTARIKDSNNRYFNFPLGRLESSGWRFMEVAFFGDDAPGGRMIPATPLTLVSLMVHETNANSTLRPGSILIDDVRIRRGSGAIEIIDTLGNTDDWGVLQATPQATADRIRASTVSPSGDGAMLFLWGEGPPLTSRGLYAGASSGDLEPLPVLASELFLKDNGHKAGDDITVSVTGSRIRARLIGSIDFFPTLDTNNESYLIADTDRLITYGNLASLFSEMKPNEVWLSTSAIGEEREDLLSQLTDSAPFSQGSVLDLSQELEASSVDPLVDTGWRALLFISFSSVLILSCIGFLIHAYVSFRSREVQFALMRTIGFSMRQLIALVWLEQILVIGAGMALGIWMGGRIGALIMPFLASDESGQEVIPPLILEVEWETLAMAYAAMGIVFALIIIGVTLFIRRISLSRVLRLGDI